MSQSKITTTFCFKLDAERARQVDEYRWLTRQASSADAIREIVDLGLEVVAKQAKAAGE